MPTFTLSINGEARTVEAQPEMPLLWALRDLLNLTGTKYSCGIGVCGSCTVLANGEAVRSCTTTLSQVGNKPVITIEGLSPDGSHPLQQAWVAEAVSQCGYCQPGQIMTAAALLAKASQPTDAEIDDAFADTLCRCGTYQRIRRAIHRAAQAD